MNFRIFLTTLLVLSSIKGKSQCLYYIGTENVGGTEFFFSKLNLEDCSDSIIFKINNANVLTQISDIAVCPDGNFYVTGNDPIGFNHFAQINMMDSTLTIVSDIPTTSNSLTCNAEGILIGGSAFGLFTYDTNTGDTGSLGFLGWGLSGDLTFRNGELYGTTFSNEFIHIPIDDLTETSVVFEYPIDPQLSAWGVVTDVISCDSMNTYITATNAHIAGIQDTLNQIYEIDPIQQTATLLCETALTITGACTPREFLASDCSIAIDLDIDDSSGASGSDFISTDIFCSTNDSIPVADLDARYYSGYFTDSLCIRLLAPAPDGIMEYLRINNTAGLSSNGTNTHKITLYPNNPFDINITNENLQNALQSIFWHNDASEPTAGIRTVEVIAFASGGRQDTAYAWFDVPNWAQAGLDTTIVLCENSPITNLESFLSTNADMGGDWSPLLASGTSLFNPTTDQPGTYFYTVGNGGCPDDSASILITLTPPPVFTLGNDTSLCAGNSLLLTIDTPPPTEIIWQDGTTTSYLEVDAPGIFWATATNSNQCSWQDSILITQADTFRVIQQATPCLFETVEWEGLSFSMDTSLCLTFNSVEGCDSIRCLEVTYQTPDSLLINASICPGGSYTIGNMTFTGQGEFLVMLPSNTGMCDTLAILTLSETSLPDPTLIDTMICPGATYDFLGTQVSNPGVYHDTLQTTGGCDSIITLTLAHWPLPSFDLGSDTALCAGSSITLTTNVPGAVSTIWQDGSIQSEFEASTPGIYWVEISNSNQCTWRDSITISPADTFRITQEAHPCAGDLFSWEGLNFTTDTSFCLLYNSYQGCDSLRCLNLEFRQTDSIFIQSTICEGDSFILENTSFYLSGLYSVTIPGSGTNCDTTAILNLEVLPTVPQTQLDSSICQGATFDFNGQILSSPGDYSDTLKTSTGCDSIVILHLSNWPNPVSPIITGDSLICTGQTASISTSGFNTYSWSNGLTSSQIDVTDAGLYSVTVSDTNGCASVGQFEVNMVYPPEFQWVYENPACYGDSTGWIELEIINGGSAPFLYQINQTGFTASPVFENLPAGSYSILIKDSYTCPYEYTIQLQNPVDWNISIFPDTLILLDGQPGNLEAIINTPGAFSFQWTPDMHLTCATCSNTTVSPGFDSLTYIIHVTDSLGCIQFDSVLVFVEKAIKGYYAPTVFNPESEGVNRYFTLFLDPDYFQETNLLRIFDRWGELLFESRNILPSGINGAWDGYYSNKMMPPGVYVWYAELKSINGDIKYISGSFTLIY